MTSTTLVAARPRVSTLTIYGSGIGLSAFLLFSVQPLVGRLALPVFGGVPAAWATVLAFFQGVLLLGYLYGHLSVTRLGLRRGAAVHVVVAVAALTLLLVAPADWSALRNDGVPPGLNLVLILAVAVGPAAFLLTATTPLLSAWYAAVRDAETPGAVDPYWLYAVSNGLSLAALLAYPLVIESTIGLSTQRMLWAVGIGAFVVVVVAAAWRVRTAVRPGPPDAASAVRPPEAAVEREVVDLRRRLRWFALAAIPTGLLTAVTTFIATDLVSAPLLWVGPLAIYLASFVVAFSGRGTRLVRWATIGAPAAATLLWVPLGTGGIWPVVPLLAVELGGYAVVATALHGRLAADRPAASRLTEFYLVIALAGVTAGAFVAFVAPVLFPDVWEYPLLVGLSVAALALTLPGSRTGKLAVPTADTEAAPASASAGDRPQSTRRGLRFGPFLDGLGGRLAPYLVVAGLLAVALLGQGPLAFEAGLRWLLVGGLVLLVGGVPRFFAVATAMVLVLAVLVLPPAPLFRDRSFYGVTVVLLGPAGDRLEILNGTTLHGVQYLDEERRRHPTTYYVEQGPVGDVFGRIREIQSGTPGAPGRSVGIVGLGAGGLVTYGEVDDRFTFYEIDPVVVRVARDASLFTYLRDAPTSPDIVVGDGRLELERVPDGTHDLLVLDAFSSDAIPVHLLTVEAIRDAMRTVAPDGLLAVHLSNRYYDLAPAVAAAARDLGLAALRRAYQPTVEDADQGAIGTIWMVLARDPVLLEPLRQRGWAPVAVDGIAPISDDHPDVLRFLAGLGAGPGVSR